MLADFPPRILPTAQVRLRSDGSYGIYDPETGRSFEAAADQSKLVQLFDGKRSLSEIAAEHLSAHGFVPFAALNDLTRALATAELLANPHEEVERVGLAGWRPWTDWLEPWVLSKRRPWAKPWLRAIEVSLWIALAVVLGLQPVSPLGPLDVPLTYVGASLALTFRARFKAAVCALFGIPPVRAWVALAFGILHAAPDHAIAVLLDRRHRILAHLAALAGTLCAMLIGNMRPGLWAGAFVVLLVDLCPFAPSSAGMIVTAVAGRLDLREHVRAYIGRRLLKKILSLHRLGSDRDLFVTALLSMGWIGLVTALVFVLGVEAAVGLIAVGTLEHGIGAVVAYVGAGLLFTLMPLLLLFLLGSLVQAGVSVLWSGGTTSGKRTGGMADLSAFRSIPLFSQLSHSDLAAMAAVSREMVFDPGHTIVEQGTRGDTFYAIRSGAVLVEREDDVGRTRPVARLGAGDCFGETALLQDGVRTATVRAITQTVATELSREAFEKIRSNFEGVDIGAVLRAAAALGESRLFRELPAEQRSALAMKFVPRSVAPGAEVVRIGEVGNEFYLIGKGRLEVLDGNGAKLGELGVGDHFGEIALLRNVPRTATVRAMTDAVLLALSRDVFLQALNTDLTLSTRIEEIAASRVSGTSAEPRARSSG
ncbi:MAG: cyclic nucleotide-binding domain-containing protein [Myxococcales bacterium]|nr:cyclic nucleotide-binding domain-containing protein [Myxococcales bacterium]